MEQTQNINGRLKYLSLKNFMCHDFFEMEFNEKINFISGLNGSGKSAIMAAIMLVLGGRATHTSRATSVKEFIMDGKRSAEINLHLKNDHNQGVKREIYGDVIMIQKIFNANSSTTNKIFGAKKTVVSTKAKDISLICNMLNIQVSNPILMLTQDMSKKFFHETTPKKLFQSVNQALQIEEILQIYQNIEEVLITIENDYKSQEELLENEYKQLQTLETKLKQFEKLRKSEQDLGIKENELHLFEYHQICTEIENLKSTIDNEELELQKLKKKRQKITDLDQTNNQNIEELSKKILDLQNQSESYSADYAKNQAIMQQLQRALKSYKLKIQAVDHNIKQKMEEKAHHESTLKEFAESDTLFSSEQLFEPDNSNSEKALKEREAHKAKRREIKKLQNDCQILAQKLESLHSMAKTQQMDRSNIEATIRKEKETGQKLGSELSYLESNLESKNREMREITNSTRNAALLYGEWVPNLLQAIEHACAQGKFNRRPKGPIGLHIKVKNNRASLALENCMKRVLRNFICNDHKDSFTLRKLFEEHCSRAYFMPTISIFKYSNQTYDIRRYRCAYPGAFTFSDLIDIDDIDVFNYIMDQIRIESILFWDDTQEAASVVSDETRRPRVCIEAYAFNGDKYQCRDGNVSNYPCNFNRSKLLANQEDKNHILQQLKTDISKIQEQITLANASKSQLAQNINEFIGRRGKCESQLEKLNAEIRDLTKQNDETTKALRTLQNLENEDSNDFSQIDGNASVVHAQQIEKFTQDIMDCQKSIDELMAEKNEWKDKWNRDTELLDKSSKLIVEVESITQGIENEIHNFEVNSRTYYDNRAKFKKELYQLTHDFEEKLQILKSTQSQLNVKNDEFENKFAETHANEMAKQASQNAGNGSTSSRRNLRTHDKTLNNSNTTREDIIKMIRELQHKINVLQKELQNDNFDYSKLAYQTQKQKLDEYELKFTQSRNDLQLFKNALELRRKGHRVLKELIHSRIKGFFQRNMEMRNFQTQMVIDEDAEEIHIHVKPDKAREFCTDLKALSGGERSYTSICLLLSLWNCLDTPFICIDEFDVFMDILNREIGKELIIANAKETNKSQMIILTPLDIGNVEMSDDISVWKLTPPKRS